MALVTQKAGAPCDLNTLFQLSGQPDHSEKRVSDQAEAEHVTWSLVKGQAQCEEQQDVVSDENRVLCVQHQPPRHRQQIMFRLCPGWL